MDILESLKQVVDDYKVVTHPFLIRFREGQLQKEHVKFWFEQQFYLSSSLASAFAALFARVPDQFWQEKRQLANLINVEAWGECGTETHSTYFQEVAHFLEIDINSLTNKAPMDFTQKFITSRLKLCLDQDISEGLAAMALGNEYLNLSLFNIYLSGMKNNPQLKGCPRKYFEVHLRDEEVDFSIFAKLFALTTSKLTTTEAIARANTGKDLLLNARMDFFTTLDKHLTSK